MRRSLWRIAAVAPVASALVLAACFDFDATTADGPLADGGPSTHPPGADAGTADGSTREGGAVDAARDVDANGANDAGGSSADAGVVDAAGFCASLVPPDSGIFFCDDFDEHALPGDWNTYEEVDGTMTVDGTTAESKPDSLDEKLPALAVDDPLNVALRTPMRAPSLPATMRFGYSLDPVQIDGTANAAIVLGAVDFLDNAGNRYSVELAINVVSGAPALALGEQSGFVDGGSAYENHALPPLQPLPMNAWSDLVIEIHWTAPTTAEAIVTVGGAQELDTPLTMTVTATSLQIGIGTSYVSEPSPVWELRYDNVFFSAE